MICFLIKLDITPPSLPIFQLVLDIVS